MAEYTEEDYYVLSEEQGSCPRCQGRVQEMTPVAVGEDGWGVEIAAMRMTAMRGVNLWPRPGASVGSEGQPQVHVGFLCENTHQWVVVYALDVDSGALDRTTYLLTPTAEIGQDPQ